MSLFGLIGYPLGHSFSKQYFNHKFEQLGLPYRYELFPLEHITDFPKLLADNPMLKGLNVTIPHKQTIIPYLDELAPCAASVGAVNTIVLKAGKSVGYNTDIVGFRQSLEAFLGQNLVPAALVLGTGGSSKAVCQVLKTMGIPVQQVSRHKTPTAMTYDEVTAAVILKHVLIINCSPVGMYPNITEAPAIPYEALGSGHYLFDLVYNPSPTEFLKRGQAQGAHIQDGLAMLHGQAEAAWVWFQT